MFTPDDIADFRKWRMPYRFATEVRELIRLTEVYTNLTNDNYETEFYHAGQAIDDQVARIERMMGYARYTG